MTAPFAYLIRGVESQKARDCPLLQRIQYAGPWLYSQSSDGTIAHLKDWPEPGHPTSSNPDDYGPPVECDDGLVFFPPKDRTTLYDMAFGDRAGEDLTLACGIKVTIPVAITQHRQFRLTGKERLGKPITEYGRLATELLEAALAADKGLDESDPRVWRLIALAFGQRYRSTPELLDHLNLIAREDVDPLLGVIWFGDPKAMRPARDGAGSSSPSSASEVQTSAPEKPSQSAAGQ